MKTLKILSVTLLVLFSLANCSVVPDAVGIADQDAASRAVTSYTEGFENSSYTGTTYRTGSFTGNNSLTWNFVQTAWAGGTISGSKSPVLGKGRSPLSEIYTTTANGVGTLTFKFKKVYSTSVSLKVYANTTLLGTVTTSGTSVVTKTYTVNKSGSVKIRFVQSSTSAGQVALDDLSWTAYSSSTGGSTGGSTDTIKIASFNIQIFGSTKVSRANVLKTLAQIATRYDVIAIQEVGSNGTPSESTATSVMNAYIAKINEIAGAGAYSYVRGHQYAFVYKNSTITKKSSGLYSGSKTFTYTPLRGHFAAKNGNFDFSLITIHTSPSKAVTEIPALTTVMSETRTYYNEQDVICMGDYNADGSYYSAGTSGGDLNGFSSSTYTTVIKNGTDTTVSPNNSYTYDRMQFFKSASTEDYTGNKGVLKFSTYYNVSNLEGTTTTAGTEAALSDHYPIWAEFYTGRDSN